MTLWQWQVPHLDSASEFFDRHACRACPSRGSIPCRLCGICALSNAVKFAKKRSGVFGVDLRKTLLSGQGGGIYNQNGGNIRIFNSTRQYPKTSDKPSGTCSNVICKPRSPALKSSLRGNSACFSLFGFITKNKETPRQRGLKSSAAWNRSDTRRRRDQRRRPICQIG